MQWKVIIRVENSQGPLAGQKNTIARERERKYPKFLSQGEVKFFLFPSNFSIKNILKDDRLKKKTVLQILKFLWIGTKKNNLAKIYA